MAKPGKLLHGLDLLEKVMLGVSKIAVFGMMILITIDVLSRRLVSHPITGVTEITQDYFMIAVVYGAMSAVYVLGGHVRVTMFSTLIPKVIIKPVNIILSLLSLVYFGVMAWSYLEKTYDAFINHQLSSGLLHYPYYPIYFVVFMGALLISIRILQHLFEPPADSEEILE